MIQYLLFVASKLLNISDIAKKIGSFFKLPIQLFYGVPYPELAYIYFFVLNSNTLLTTKKMKIPWEETSMDALPVR